MHATLKKNINLFAWTPSDMSGVSPGIITHRLSVFKEARPISQNKRDYGDEKRLAAKAEAEKLLSAGFIREAWYTTWLANFVMVTKPNGNWRMCVEYKNLNSACSKDSYPLPNIDPEKCTFGVEGGKFLGFMLTHRGTKANPDKCQAIVGMRSPKNIKEVQPLLGRLTALSRFLPRLAEQKAAKFTWEARCEEIFKELKDFLISPSVIQNSRPDKPILVYLPVSKEAISVALVKEVENEERPIYFVSQMLHATKTRYQMIEKVELTLVLTARRMRPYFQNHSIAVRTDYPIFKFYTNPTLQGG